MLVRSTGEVFSHKCGEVCSRINPNRGWRLIGVVPVVVAIVAGLLAGCSGSAPDQGGLPGGLAPITASGSETVKGRLAPRRYVELASYTGGRAGDVLAAEGDQVEAGQALVLLDGYQQAAAQVAQSELEVVLSQQALDDLYREAKVDLAEAQVAAAQAVKAQALAEDRYQSYSRRPSQDRIDQAKANLVLAAHRMQLARQDLEKAQKHFDNRNSLWWRFLNQRQFKLRLTQLKAELAQYERRYWDAKDKYQDLTEPVDQVELALRAGDLAVAQARLDQAQRARDKLLNGPDPDRLESARARLNAAQEQLAAARTALHAYELVSPMHGQVVRLEVEEGEWLPAGQPVVVVADLSRWLVETQDLGEDLAASVHPGERLDLRLEAYPDQTLSGQVESVDLDYREEEGDIYYDAKIELQHAPPGLRWGMTASIQF